MPSNINNIFLVFKIGLTFLSLTTFVSVQGQSAILQCFSCISQAGDLTCLNDPEQVTVGSKVVDCENGWCTIKRQEPTEMPGEIVSFLRGCEKSQPQFLDDVVADAHHVFYYRSCRSTKCNNGDGLSSLGGGGGGGGGSGGGSGSNRFLMVAEESGTSTLAISTLLLICTLGFIRLAQ